MAIYNPYVYQQQMQQQMQQQQIQQNGLMPAPNEEYARNYPLAYGQSVTFKDEKEPFIYVKTMGMSQFESPNFEKYRLVKEETEVTKDDGLQKSLDALREDLEREVYDLRSDVTALAEKVQKMGKKKEVVEDE